MPPRVTWLLPVRDGMPYLRDALESIAAQSYRGYEVLAWDNGSKDATVEVLREWIPHRLPGRVVVDRPFERLGGCLRAMVEEARSEFVARIDADDVNEPERLARQIEELDRRPTWQGLGCWTRSIDVAGEPGALFDGYPLDPLRFRWELFFFNPLPHPTAYMRREAVLRAGNYADVGTGQDWDLWYRMALRGPLGNLPEPLVRYRSHSESVGARHRREWSGLGRGLAEKYAERLFPGVSRETALQVWDFFSIASDAEGRGSPPSPRAVYAMAVACARAACRPPHELLAAPKLRGMLRGCVRRSPMRLASWLAVSLAVQAGRFAAGPSLSRTLR